VGAKVVYDPENRFEGGEKAPSRLGTLLLL
jgi:hypothetical protein